MKTFKCKKCPHTEEGNSPSVLLKHARDAHGITTRGRRNGDAAPRNGRRRRAETEKPDVDAESELLVKCTDLFVNAETDRDGDQRVLEYLAARFGPAAYGDESEDEEPAEE